jgi:hypothetical protein
MYDIKLDWDHLNVMHVPVAVAGGDQDSMHIEDMCPDTVPESEVLAARHHTMIWNEDECLNITSGHHATPLNIIYKHVEKLSFPSMYYDEPCAYNLNMSVMPYITSTWRSYRFPPCTMTSHVPTT